MRPWLTIRFREAEALGVAVVTLEITDQDETAHPGSLVLDLETWGRIWRSLVQSAEAFEAEGISLVRTHARERMDP